MDAMVGPSRRKVKMDELKVGDKIKDNDARMTRRVLEVVGLECQYVMAKNVMNRTVRILRNRIFTDTRERKTGFSRI